MATLLFIIAIILLCYTSWGIFAPDDRRKWHEYHRSIKKEDIKETIESGDFTLFHQVVKYFFGVVTILVSNSLFFILTPIFVKSDITLSVSIAFWVVFLAGFIAKLKFKKDLINQGWMILPMRLFFFGYYIIFLLNYQYQILC